MPLAAALAVTLMALAACKAAEEALPTATPEATPTAVATPAPVETGIPLAEEGTYVVEVATGSLWIVGPATSLRWSPRVSGVFIQAICCTEVKGLNLIDLSSRTATRIYGNVMFYTWSPDGRRIAFTRFANGPQGLYLINEDASGMTRLTDELGIAGLAWSPDGKLIAFTDGKYVQLMDLSTRKVSRISEPLGQASFLGAPAWSPDGTRLAFCMDHAGTAPRLATYLYDLVGGSLTRVADVCSEYSWSPDGKRLLYTDAEGILLVAADGSKPPQLLAEGRSPIWSHDGTRIGYISEGCGNDGLANFDIFTIRPDGTFKKRLTNMPETFNETPAWSPAGDAIAFASSSLVEESQALLASNVDSGQLRTLATVISRDLHLHGANWSPDGRYIAFLVTAGGHGVCD